MGRQKHTAEQIISKLREAEVLQAEGVSMEEVLKQLRANNAKNYWRARPGRKPKTTRAMHTKGR